MLYIYRYTGVPFLVQDEGNVSSGMASQSIAGFDNRGANT